MPLVIWQRLHWTCRFPRVGWSSEQYWLFQPRERHTFPPACVIFSFFHQHIAAFGVWSFPLLNSVAQLCLILSDPVDCSTPGPTVSPTPRACSNSCPLSQWCHPTISSSVVPFSYLQSVSALGSFPVSQFFASCSQSIGVSASTSVLPMHIQDWFPLGWTGWTSLQSKGLSRVFNTTVQKHHFFDTQLSL